MSECAHVKNDNKKYIYIPYQTPIHRFPDLILIIHQCITETDPF